MDISLLADTDDIEVSIVDNFKDLKEDLEHPKPPPRRKRLSRPLKFRTLDHRNRKSLESTIDSKQRLTLDENVEKSRKPQHNKIMSFDPPTIFNDGVNMNIDKTVSFLSIFFKYYLWRTYLRFAYS